MIVSAWSNHIPSAREQLGAPVVIQNARVFDDEEKEREGQREGQRETMSYES